MPAPRPSPPAPVRNPRHDRDAAPRPQGLPGPPRVDILGVPVHRLDRSGARATIALLTARPGHDVVAFVNAHASNLAVADLFYRRALHRASLVLNDGVGISLAARFQGTPFVDNLNGTDLVPLLLADFAVTGRRVFFYGSAPGVAERAAAHWRTRLPDLQVAGALDGFTLSGAAAAEVIRATRADVVLVALGNPRQELWASELGHRTGASLTVGVGAFFDFSTGVVRRAPRAVRGLRLEWAFRLLHEPRRLARRYLVGNPAFLLRVAVARVRPVGPLPSAEVLRRHPSARRSAAYRHGTSDVVVPGPWAGSPTSPRPGVEQVG